MEARKTLQKLDDPAHPGTRRLLASWMLVEKYKARRFYASEWLDNGQEVVRQPDLVEVPLDLILPLLDFTPERGSIKAVFQAMKESGISILASK